MSKIVLEHIDKYYGENHVLRDITELRDIAVKVIADCLRRHRTAHPAALHGTSPRPVEDMPLKHHARSEPKPGQIHFPN